MSGRYKIKKHSIITMLLFLSVYSNFAAAQQQYNLVPNPGFEDYTSCPFSGSIDALNVYPDHWYKPDKRGAGFWHACANTTDPLLGVPVNSTACGPGFQNAKSGNGYIGLFFYNSGDSRNYFQVKLTDSLRRGKCYYVEFFVNLQNSCRLSCNNQAALLTKTAVYVDTANNVMMMPANPQVLNHGNLVISDTLNWTRVSGVIIAEGEEQFLTIGNFKNNAQTTTVQTNPGGGASAAGYFVDDVSVIPLDSFPLPADAGIDRTIQQGQSTYIGSYTNGLTNITWYNSSGAAIATGVPGLTITPSANTFYVIEQTVCGNYSKDTVYVYVQPMPLNFIHFTIALVPLSFGEGLGVRCHWRTANEVNVSHFNIQRSKDGVTFYTIGKLYAKNTLLNEYSFTDQYPFAGVNYYRIISVDKDGKTNYSSIQRMKTDKVIAGIHMYPNPAKDAVTIEGMNIQKVIVTDAAGRIMITKHFSSTNVVQLSTASLNKGFFFVKVFDKTNAVNIQKLVIE